MAHPPRPIEETQTRRTKAIVIYPTEYSGSNAVERYRQGVECRSVDSIFKYVTVKPRSNNDLLEIKEGIIQAPNQIFDDCNSETPASLRIGTRSTYTGVRSAINHELSRLDLGQSLYRFHDGSPFTDHFITDPIEIMRLFDEEILPDTFTVDSNGFEVDDAFISPLYGRPNTKEEKVEKPFRSRGISGDLSTPDNIGNSFLIVQMIEKNDSRVISLEGLRGGINRRELYLAGSDFYVDGVEYFAQDANIDGILIRTEGFIKPNNSEILPFSDSKDSEIFFSTINDNSSRDMESALFDMGTGVDWGFFDRNHISCTSGFVYNNCSYGTDSMAYGGLLR